jgi:hypothetical protein
MPYVVLSPATNLLHLILPYCSLIQSLKHLAMQKLFGTTTQGIFYTQTVH